MCVVGKVHLAFVSTCLYKYYLVSGVYFRQRPLCPGPVCQRSVCSWYPQLCLHLREGILWRYLQQTYVSMRLTIYSSLNMYLSIILLRALAGKYNNGNVNEVEICGLFWHFVDLVWILVFTFIYLI